MMYHAVCTSCIKEQLTSDWMETWEFMNAHTGDKHSSEFIAINTATESTLEPETASETVTAAVASDD